MCKYSWFEIKMYSNFFENKTLLQISALFSMIFFVSNLMLENKEKLQLDVLIFKTRFDSKKIRQK